MFCSLPLSEISAKISRFCQSGNYSYFCISYNVQKLYFNSTQVTRIYQFSNTRVGLGHICKVKMLHLEREKKVGVVQLHPVQLVGCFYLQQFQQMYIHIYVHTICWYMYSTEGSVSDTQKNVTLFCDHEILVSKIFTKM